MAPVPATQAWRAPDPFEPLAMEDRGQGRSLQRQRARRAGILAATRRMLSEGDGGFSLRRLADDCGTTTQTLRNCFGRREDVLVAAFNEHTSAVWRTLTRASSGPCMFLDLADIYHRCAATRPTFLRAMVTSAIANVRSLSDAQRHGVDIKSRHLRTMLRDGSLRTDVDPAALAAHVTRLNTFMMYEWAMGGEASDLHGAMIDGNRRLLLGAVTTAHAAAVEAWQPRLC